MKTKSQKTVKCPACRKVHAVDKKTYEQFGYDCYCIRCTDRDHIHFMQTTGRRLKMKCVKNCFCGFGN